MEPKPGKVNFQSNVLNTLFKELAQNNVRYCVLRNYEELPEKMLSKDIDILIEKKELNKAVDAIKKSAIINHVDSFFYTNFQYVKSITLLKNQNGVYISLKIDYFFNFEYRGSKLLSAESILNNSRYYKNFCVVDSVQEGIILWLNPLISGNVIKGKYVNRILQIAKRQQNEFKGYMIKILGDSLTAKLWPFMEEGNLKATSNYLRTIKTASWLRSFFREPFDVTRNFLKHLYVEIKRRISPKKRMFVIIGPDGTGKSTLTEQLRSRISELIKGDINKIKICHFRPNLIPNIKKLITLSGDKTTSDVFNHPHRAEPSNFVVSLARLFYYFIDYTIGYLAKVRPLFGKHYIILFDRYYYDFIVDPARSRIQLPKFIPLMLLRLIPKPTITLVLDNDSKTILCRKKELSREEINRQLCEYRLLAKKIPDAYIIDARKSISEILNEVDEIFIKVTALSIARIEKIL